MKYRTLGRTGLEISEIGLGGHEYRRKHLVADGRFTSFDPSRPIVVAEAIERGINYFDTTFIEECHSLGNSIRSANLDRSKMVISGMSISTLKRVAEVDRSRRRRFLENELNERLQLIGSDYFDIFQICCLESGYSEVVLDEVLESMQAWKSDGRIRFLGASSHDSDLLSRVIEERDPFDVVMARCNFNEGRHERLFSAVSERNVGFIAIKPLVWFDYGVSFVPLCRSIIERWPRRQPTAAQHAIAWILSNSEVSTTIPSANSIEEMRENAQSSDIQTGSIDIELLKSCAGLPNRSEEMIDLLDHPFEEVRSYAKPAVVRAVNADFGFEKARYREILVQSDQNDVIGA